MAATSEKFRWLVRAGFAARGIVYLLFGYLALGTAGEARDGQSAVFDYLQDVPLGVPLLYVMALGLLGYATFRFMSAIGDIQHRGSGTEGAVKRVGDAASGVAHLFLAYASYQFASGAKQTSDGGSSGEQMAGSVLAMDLGPVLIGLIGLGFLAAAGKQAYNAWTGDFMKRVSAGAPSGIRTAGRVGHAARAVVFAVIGWSMVQGAWLAQEGQIKGLGEALLSLRDMGALYTLVAIGLILFGAFSLVVARYRIIPELGIEGLKPKF
ncbi:DUF1206 domain-containing protein [Pelagerythrobacter sp.]|uniref:DUF1206 domain-containing protein n=1 Tax=Pelagerythrobacter sp. TaxID=2800702 RepID=UPI0035AFCC83